MSPPTVLPAGPQAASLDEMKPTRVETVEDSSNAANMKQLTTMDTYRTYSPEYSKEVEGRLVRKIDLRLLPIIVVIYLFNYLDRNSITQARLYGLQADTNVHGATYNTAISIFSAGYIAMQLPSTLILTKVQPHIFIPACICTWALVSGLTSATSSPGGLLAVRFCLGLVEAPFFPGAMYFLSCWYTKRELGKRMGLLICAILLSNMVAGLISAGILSGMAGVGRLAAWRWLFILEGLATFMLGVAAFFLLPDYPGTTSWLTDEEKIVAQGRLAADAGTNQVIGEDNLNNDGEGEGNGDDVSVLRGIDLAVRDYRVWLFACLQMSTSASISYSHFFPTLIQQLGFKNNTIVLLMTSPPYLFAFIWALSLAVDADRRGLRSPHAALCAVVAIAASICLIALDQQHWARYVLTFFVSAGTFGVYATMYPWLSSTIMRPPVKRAAAIGISNTCSNIAALYAAYFWLDEYLPWYRQSWACILGLEALALFCIIALRVSLKRSNARFDKLAAEINPDDLQAVRALKEDEQRAVVNGFRYVT